MCPGVWITLILTEPSLTIELSWYYWTLNLLYVLIEFGPITIGTLMNYKCPDIKSAW